MSATVLLRQAKDQYLLEEGKEVVLVVQPEHDDGYYHIAGGGDGLFRVNEGTGAVEGELLDSLLETAGEAAPAEDTLTLQPVYDLLVSMM